MRAARLRASTVLFLLLGGMGAAWALTRHRDDELAFSPAWCFVVCAAAGMLAPMLRARGQTLADSGRLTRPTAALPAALLACAVFMFGAGWWLVRTSEPRGTLAATLRRESPVLMTVRGVMLDRPDVTNTVRGILAPFLRGTPSARFRLAVRDIRTDAGWAPASGVLRVRVSGIDGVDRGVIQTAAGNASAGDVITLTGEAKGTGIIGADVLGNPGETDARAWSAQEGIAGSLRVVSPQLVTLEPAATDNWPDRAARRLLRMRADLRHAAVRALAPRDLPSTPAGYEDHAAIREEARALLLSLVLGLDEFRQDQVEQRFTRLGVVHVLAISGYHVAVLALLVASALRLTGDRGRWESLVVMAAVVAYAAIVPASAPVLRAAVCMIAVMASRSLGRRYDDVCVLIWTAVVLALWKPVEAFSLGYVLSFGLCSLLMVAGDRAHGRLAGPRLRGLVPDRYQPWRRIGRSLSRAATATVLCWTVSAPIIAWWTGWFSPAAILASIVIVPLVSALLAAGLADVLVTVVLGAVWPGVAHAAAEAFAGWLDPAAGMVVGLVRWIDGLPLGSLRVPPISLAWALSATAIALAWFLRGHPRHGPLWVATAAAAAWLGVEALAFWPRMGLDARTMLRADVLSIGEGLCVSLRAPGDRGVESLLVDAGSRRTTLGLRAVPAALRSVGAWRVDAALILGDQPEHFTLLADVARAVGLRRALVNRSVIDHADADGAGLHAALLRELQRLGVEIVPITAGMRCSLGRSCQVELLAGRAGLRALVRDGHGPLALLTHDAPATETNVPAVIAASTAAGRIGLEQLLRETRAGTIVLSTDRPRPGVLATGSGGMVTLAWDQHGTVRVAVP